MLSGPWRMVQREANRSKCPCSQVDFWAAEEGQEGQQQSVAVMLSCGRCVCHTKALYAGLQCVQLVMSVCSIAVAPSGTTSSCRSNSSSGFGDYVPSLHLAVVLFLVLGSLFGSVVAQAAAATTCGSMPWAVLLFVQHWGHLDSLQAMLGCVAGSIAISWKAYCYGHFAYGLACSKQDLLEPITSFGEACCCMCACTLNLVPWLTWHMQQASQQWWEQFMRVNTGRADCCWGFVRSSSNDHVSCNISLQSQGLDHLSHLAVWADYSAEYLHATTGWACQRTICQISSHSSQQYHCLLHGAPEYCTESSTNCVRP